jgi:2-polyprenyl-3-methyl-5-hydroxy-6-metoxy-1,4-benzoquinol methylase
MVAALRVGTDMNEQGLADKEWQAAVWGNIESNLEFLRRVGSLGESPSILEIGCGKGMLLNSLQKRGYTVTGIDLDPTAIDACHTSFPTLAAQVGSGDAIPFPAASFDVVLSFDVFEHIRDSDLHLREVVRVLRPGGSYLLQTPNKWTNIPFEIVRHWRKYRMGPIAGYRELLKEHCALHNYWQLQRRFARHGFTSEFVPVPVVNDHFRAKMRTYFGFAARPLLTLLNPDRFPQPLRTNFYVKANHS